jgi:hypothetical protein
LAALKIPGPYQPGILLLASAQEDAFQELLNALGRAPSSFATQKSLGVWIASEIKGFSAPQVSNLIETLTSLYRVRLRKEVGVPTLVADVIDAAKEGIPAFASVDTEAFRSRLSSLLVIDSLNLVTFKAKELQIDSERTFCDVRILTDVRPVFGEDPTQTPADAIVIHTLKLGYHDSNSRGHKEFFVALDNADIDSLMKTLQRAKDKVASLKPVIDKSGMRSIELS